MNTGENIRDYPGHIRGERHGTAKMPMLFVGHGSPMNAIEENEFVNGWREVARTIPTPEAILCISAHWETRGTYVTSMEKPRTIHDFGGFPQELFEIQYPVPGSPELAKEIIKTVTSTEILPDEKWGLDHGCWSVLMRMYPETNIPVVQLSLDYTKPPQHHYDLAKQLSPLRSKKILIIGSGNMVHNLRLVDWSKLEEPELGYDWALEANDKIKRMILSADHEALINYSSQGKSLALSIPTPEHFLPLLYVLSLKERNEKAEIFNDKAVMGSLTMTSLKISES
jgi:4,5-DOPA dioxygenase extradiol